MNKEKILAVAGAALVIGSMFSGCTAQTKIEDQGNFALIENQTPPQVQESRIVELKDGDSYDLNITYVNKVINGVTYPMIAYNGSIPGPTFKVPQGAEITIHLKNNTDIPTSLHSHGVRLEDRYDGIVDVQQKPIDPGQTFTYKIKFPDAGMFWYHPHLHEPYAQSHGLYGNYWVIPQDQNFWASVNEEIPLMLNDLLILDDKTDVFDPTVDYALMGKFGNTMLVNGSTDYRKTFKQGEVVRFYITNAANTRVFNLSIPNAKMKLVGGDNGKHERETWQDTIIISPSERIILEVLFEKPGVYVLQSSNPLKTFRLATFTVIDQKIDRSFENDFQILRENLDVKADIDEFRGFFDKKPDKSIVFTVDMKAMGGHMMPNGQMMNGGRMAMMESPSGSDHESIEWEDTMPMMNEMSTTSSVQWKIIDEQSKKENMDIDWKFKVGDKVKVKIYNDPNSSHPMQHPLHFHGQRFLVLSTNGIKNSNLIWKDTVLVPKGDTVEILVDMSNPGKWMAHCHISEHLASGMMLPFEVQ